MKSFKELLVKLDACEEAKTWAADKTWKEVYTTCHRGDWLLWLFKRTNKDDLRLLTLAKGHCAATVKHLMKDPRSIAAVEAAIAFGNGEITIEQLKNDAADAAYAAAYAAYAAYAAADAAYAAYAAAYAADAAYAAADAAYAAYAAADAAYAAYAAAYAADAAAYTKNQQLTANIVRQYIPFELWNVK